MATSQISEFIQRLGSIMLLRDGTDLTDRHMRWRGRGQTRNKGRLFNLIC